MQGYVGNTDHGWYTHLLQQPHLEEVNFWLPGEHQGFGAIPHGAPFFFKLKAPHDAIVGFGQFSRFEWMPIWLAWEVFGEANGMSSEEELVARLARLHPGKRVTDRIGCVFIAFPVFFPPDQWVHRPDDWRKNAVRGLRYDLSVGEGRRIWDECTETAAGPSSWVEKSVERDRYGAPVVVHPRLGQGSFRFAVLDAYGGACAVTTEHSLPVLDAAHIRPYARGGKHGVSNGLPLRKDLHRLFDLGYLTVRCDRGLAVSRRLRDDYANGRTYYALEGQRLVSPASDEALPSRDVLEWHRDSVFLG